MRTSINAFTDTVAPLATESSPVVCLASGSASAPLVCEIRATPEVAQNLERVVAFCAEQSGRALTIELRAPEVREVTVTLHVAPEHAAGDTPLFCFICRLACLCPEARVGVFVPAQDLFAPERIRHAS